MSDHREQDSTPERTLEERRYVEYVDEILLQSEHPVGGDPCFRAMSVATLAELEQDDFRELTRDYLRQRPELDPSHAYSLFTRDIQHVIRRFPEVQDQLGPYPQATYEDPDTFTRFFGWLREQDEAMAEFTRVLCEERIRSLVPDRYQSFFLLMSLFEERFGRSPRWLDFGSGPMHGQLYVMLGIPFSPVAVVEEDMSGDKPALTTNVEMTANLAQTGNALFKPRCVGVDLADPFDPRQLDWVEDSSHYPTELRDPAKLATHRILNDQHLPDARFVQADLTHPDFEPGRIGEPHSFDLVTMSTMKYQLNDEQRAVVDAWARHFAGPDGIVVTQDFAEQSLDGEGSLFFPLHRLNYPYLYRTYVEDMRDPGNLQEIFRFETARCRRVQLGFGQLSVGGRLRRANEDLFIPS